MKLKICSVCGKECYLWKANPKMCKVCAQKQSSLKTAEKPVKSKDEKSLPELIQLCVLVFNKAIKQRDSFDGRYFCISCDKEGDSKEAHAGHYLSAGNNGILRFDFRNVNLQCPKCNLELMGNQANYRIGLINKIGKEQVLELESMAKLPFKYDKANLTKIINQIRTKGK